jgi:hypothetical protein
MTRVLRPLIASMAILDLGLLVQRFLIGGSPLSGATPRN